MSFWTKPIAARDLVIGLLFLIFGAGFVYLYVQAVKDRAAIESNNSANLVVLYQQTKINRMDFVRPKKDQTPTSEPVYFITMETTNAPVSKETMVVIGSRNPIRPVLKITKVEGVPLPGGDWTPREFFFLTQGTLVEVVGEKWP